MEPASPGPSADAVADLVGDVASGGAPLYRVVADALRRGIADGRLPSGTRLPAERTLARELRLSRVTVVGAYRDLREQGWAVTRHGSGTYVAVPTGRAPWGDALRGVGGPLDLGIAAPQASPYLTTAYEAALKRLSTQRSSPGYSPDGLPVLRQAIATRYTARGMPTAAEQILVTCGASDALDAVLRALLAPGCRVLHEHPSYPGGLDVIAAIGGTPVPVAVDAAHPAAIVSDVDRAARQHAPTLAYLMPDHSNPSGVTLDTPTRRALAATLARHRVSAVIDEVTAELGAESDTEPFGARVPETAVVHVGSMSKTVWGGMRVGWVRADHATLARVSRVLAHRQLGVSVLDQLAAVELFGAWDGVLAHRRSELRRGRDVLAAALTDRLPDWDFRLPTGGLSLWCRLPDGQSSAHTVAAAAGRGLILQPGSRFGTGHAFDDRLRLPFTRPAAELEAAVDILAGLPAGSDRRPMSSSAVV